jgi:hypothetical protein
MIFAFSFPLVKWGRQLSPGLGGVVVRYTAKANRPPLPYGLVVFTG